MSIKAKNRVGQQFNYLTILEYIPKKTIFSNGVTVNVAYYKCKCICGVEKIIVSSNVISSSIKSCGCKKKELCRIAVDKYYSKKYKFPVERKLFGDYKKDGRNFTLTLDEFCTLVNKNCHYCGAKPFLIRGNKTKSRLKALNGIDRIDSSIGYHTENCVPCCIHCNKAKLDRSVEDFKKWIRDVYKHLYPEVKGRN